MYNREHLLWETIKLKEKWTETVEKNGSTVENHSINFLTFQSNFEFKRNKEQMLSSD